MGISDSGGDAPATARPLFSWRFANAKFNEATGELQVAGQPVQVEPRPLRLLAELLHHTNEVVTKEELFEVVWEGRVTVDNVLANAVTKLRRALGEEAGARIVNVPRVGYRLVGAVERVAVGELPPANLELHVGMRVPGRPAYELRQTLGATGRGNVWLASHVKTGQQRVFKFAVDAPGLRSLKREFTLCRLLRHSLGERDDLVQMFDCSFSNSPYHVECEYGGSDLLTWAHEGGRLAAMTVQDRLALFIAVAQAVANAHSVGVLHKDLKPANVLMCERAGLLLPKLTDFGSGHAVDGAALRDLGLTAMGLTLTDLRRDEPFSGTVQYLAPETLSGAAATVQGDI